MARTPDPTGLSIGEALEARDLFRSVRTLKGLTNGQIAEHLGWTDRRLTDALTEQRTLLAGAAYEMLKAVAEMRCQRDGSSKLEADSKLLRFWVNCTWVKTLRSERRPDAAVIPDHESKRLAWHLAVEVSKTNGVGKIGPSKVQAIADQLSRYFRKNGPAMAMSWYELTQRVVGQVVEQVIAVNGVYRADGFGEFPLQEVDLHRASSPLSVARESVYISAVIGFAERKKSRADTKNKPPVATASNGLANDAKGGRPRKSRAKAVSR